MVTKVIDAVEVEQSTGVTYTLNPRESGVCTYNDLAFNMVTPEFSSSGTGEDIQDIESAESELAELLGGVPVWTTTGNEGSRIVLVCVRTQVLPRSAWTTARHTAFRHMSTSGIEDLKIFVRTYNVTGDDDSPASSEGAGHQVTTPASLSTNTVPARATARRRGRGRQGRSPVQLEVGGIQSLLAYNLHRLGEIFGVSRQAVHAWLDGKSPSPSHREHVLSTFVALNEASSRFSSTTEFRNWLDTPLSPGSATRPIDFLRDRQFATFHGLMLQEPPALAQGFIRPVAPLPFVYQERPEEEYKAQLHRLQRSTGRAAEDDMQDPFE